MEFQKILENPFQMLTIFGKACTIAINVSFRKSSSKLAQPLTILSSLYSIQYILDPKCMHNRNLVLINNCNTAMIGNHHCSIKVKVYCRCFHSSSPWFWIYGKWKAHYYVWLIHPMTCHLTFIPHYNLYCSYSAILRPTT